MLLVSLSVSYTHLDVYKRQASTVVIRMVTKMSSSSVHSVTFVCAYKRKKTYSSSWVLSKNLRNLHDSFCNKRSNFCTKFNTNSLIYSFTQQIQQSQTTYISHNRVSQLTELSNVLMSFQAYVKRSHLIGCSHTTSSNHIQNCQLFFDQTLYKQSILTT